MVHAYTPPYGFMRDEDGLLVPCLEEQRTLYVMRSLREDSKLTYRQIARALNQQGFLNGEEKPWTAENVRSLFRRGRMVAVGTPPEPEPDDDGLIEVDPRDANKLMEPERTISIKEIELTPAEQMKLLRKKLRRIAPGDHSRRWKRYRREVNNMLRRRWR